MARVLKYGQMVLATLGAMSMERRMEKESLNGVMVLHMRETSRTTILKVLEI